MTHWLLVHHRWMLFLPALFVLLFAAVALARQARPGLHIDVATPTLLVWAFATAVAVAPALLFMGAGLLRRWRRPADPPGCGQGGTEPCTRFVVVVPAYNEERVIANSVGSLLAQDYPADLVCVHVACNGRDGTAARARALGARVYETARQGIGKSAAIAELLAHTEVPEDAYIVVFDADNLVVPGFLRALDRRIQATGAPALQGNHQPLTSSDNLVSTGIRAAYRASSMFYSVGRSWLLGSALLCGTGFAVQARLFQAIWPLVRTQTEDIECNALLQLHHGAGVTWVDEAVFYDEKPDQVAIAIRQRVRWMVGHFHTGLLYVRPLLAQAVRERSLRPAELALYYLFPLALFLSTAWLLLAVPLIAAGAGSFHPASAAWVVAGTLLGLLYLLVLPALASLLEQGRATRGTLATALGEAVAALLVSLLVWTHAILLAALSLRRRDWIFHTPHKAAAPLPAR